MIAAAGAVSAAEHRLIGFRLCRYRPDLRDLFALALDYHMVTTVHVGQLTGDDTEDDGGAA